MNLGSINMNIGPPVKSCPGLYCGRSLLENGSWSDCGACPRGYRTNLTSYCQECEDEPTLYDWQYLGFMALLPLVLNWICIDWLTPGRRTKEVISQHFCALLEVSCGVLAALLSVSPAGSPTLRICSPKALSDWYTLLHNPQPDYKETLYCTQEAVYPLYTVVLLMYAYSLLMTISLRPWLVAAWRPTPCSTAIYCALYFYPALVLLHTVAAGLIYASFPYIIIIISMVASATHFSVKPNQSAGALLASCFLDLRNFIILICHWLVHAYGLISITGFKDPLFDGILLTLVPAPAAFYILTAQFTDPLKNHCD